MLRPHGLVSIQFGHCLSCSHLGGHVAETSRTLFSFPGTIPVNTETPYGNFMSLYSLTTAESRLCSQDFSSALRCFSELRKLLFNSSLFLASLFIVYCLKKSCSGWFSFLFNFCFYFCLHSLLFPGGWFLQPQVWDKQDKKTSGDHITLYSSRSSSLVSHPCHVCAFEFSSDFFLMFVCLLAFVVTMCRVLSCI